MNLEIIILSEVNQRQISSDMTSVLIRRGRHTRGAHTQRKCHVKTQLNSSHLPAKERDFRRSQTSYYLDLGLAASRTVGK